jgi:hypothetical protein
MFLLNSWVPYVSDTFGRKTSKGSDYPEVTRLICRIPLTTLLQEVLAF